MQVAKLIDSSSILRPYTIGKVARIESSDNLMHYGIKGMKWGVRRTKEQLAHDRSSIQARMNSQLRTPVKLQMEYWLHVFQIMPLTEHKPNQGR